LTQDRLRHQQARQNETSEQRQNRLETAQRRQQQARQNETPEQRTHRLHQDLLRRQHARLNETPDQHQTRLDGQRIRQNVNRTQSDVENKTFTEIASTIINDLETPIPSISDNIKFFDKATKPFIKTINNLKFLRCEDVVVQHGQPILKGCKEGFFSSTLVNKCKTCKSNDRKIMHPNPEERLSVRKFTQANNMDPFPCDKMTLLPSFPDLTQIEEMLISLAHPIMSVYRIRHNIKYRMR